MKTFDCLRLALQEIKINYAGTFITILVQIFLFTVIFCITGITFDLENAFERYINKNNYCDYSVELKNVVYNDLQTLKDMGFSDINLEVENLYENTVFFDGKQIDDTILFSQHPADNNIKLEIKEGMSFNNRNNNNISGVWLSEQTANKYHIHINDNIEVKINDAKNALLLVKGIYKGDNTAIYISFKTFCDELYNKTDSIIAGTATIASIKGYMFKEMKLKRHGIIIWNEDIEEIVNVIMCSIIILVGIATVLYIMFFGTFSTNLSVKIYMRKEYIKMLHYVGFCEKDIKNIFLFLFNCIHLCSLIISLLLSRICLTFLNYDIINIKGLFFSEIISVRYILAFFIIDILILRIVFHKSWRKYIIENKTSFL